MKIYISYFYQIRFFKPWMVPVSTACGDPLWYHNWNDKYYTFLDKRGIVNGLRCEELYPDKRCEGLCCGGCDETIDKKQCKFKQQYRKQLEELNLDKFLTRTNTSLKRIKEQLSLKQEPVLVLIVHEAPVNICSEREVLIDYFNSHGIECQELKYPIGENYED